MLWVVAAGCVVVFVGRAWLLPRLVAKNKGQVVRSGVDAIVALALVRALVPPPVRGSGCGWRPPSPSG